MRRLLLLSFACFVLTGCGKSAPPDFDIKLPEYLTDPGDLREAALTSPRAKVKLKLITVDMTRKRIDAEVYHALPEELRAATPDEVGTVVKIFWNEVPVTQGRTFYKVEAFLVDAKTSKVNWEFSVQGGASKFKNRSGTRPVELVVDAIKRLCEARD